MANNAYVNKVQLANGTVLIDISDTTAAASDVAAGKIFYTAAGVPTTGSAVMDSGGIVSVVDTTDVGGGTIRTISVDEVALISTSITANGTYNAPSTAAFNNVTVNVGSFTANQIAFGGMTGDIVLTESGTIKDAAFQNQTSITSVRGDQVTRINAYAFDGCTSLAYATFPNVNHMYAVYAFRNCTSLITACFPKLGTSPYVKYFDGGTFYGCSSLTTADLNVVTNLSSNTFNGCTHLTTLILRRADGVTAIGNTNSFTNTPFASGGSGGTIYIPKTLYDHLGDGTSSDYKAATNWSTVDGYGTITWAKIEGSYYETHYADGTTIPTS